MCSKKNCASPVKKKPTQQLKLKVGASTHYDCAQCKPLSNHFGSLIELLVTGLVD